jgi:hypothetical protein
MFAVCARGAITSAMCDGAMISFVMVFRGNVGA